MMDNSITPASNKNLQNNPLSNLWNISKASLNEATKTSNLYKTTHGMLEGVPLICQDDACPYKDVCIIDESYRIMGQRCLMEAGAIMARFESWCSHWNRFINRKNKGY
jgi:hypothetical protein